MRRLLTTHKFIRNDQTPSPHKDDAVLIPGKIERSLWDVFVCQSKVIITDIKDCTVGIQKPADCSPLYLLPESIIEGTMRLQK